MSTRGMVETNKRRLHDGFTARPLDRLRAQRANGMTASRSGHCSLSLPARRSYRWPGNAVRRGASHGGDRGHRGPPVGNPRYRGPAVRQRPGDQSLREQITEVMAPVGVHAHPDDIVVTAGSQMALDLVTRIFCDPGDVVLVEAPSYVGALGSSAPTRSMCGTWPWMTRGWSPRR